MNDHERIKTGTQNAYQIKSIIYFSKVKGTKNHHHHSILDIETHFKPTETSQYTHFSGSHPPRVQKGIV